MERQCYPSQAQVMLNREWQDRVISKAWISASPSTWKVNSLPLNPTVLDILQEWVTGPTMWALKGMGLVEIVWEMEETHWRWAKAKQMAWPRCRWQRNHSSRLTNRAYTQRREPGEGQRRRVQKAPGLAKNSHRVHGLVKNQTPVVWAAQDWWGAGAGDGEGRSGILRNTEQLRTEPEARLAKTKKIRK